MSDGLLLDEIGAWTAKYERLRSLVAAELGLPDADAIAAAEARGYAKAVAVLRAIRAEFSRNSDSDAILTDAIRQLEFTKETTDHA